LYCLVPLVSMFVGDEVLEKLTLFRVSVVEEYQFFLQTLVYVIVYTFTAIPALILIKTKNHNFKVYADFLQRRAQQSNILKLGRMTSGICQMVEQPLVKIEEQVQGLSLEEVKKIEPKLHSLQEEVGNVTSLLSSLKFFSRQTENEAFKETALSEIIDHCSNICKIQFGPSKVPIRFITNVDENQRIHCKPSMLIQLLVDIIQEFSQWQLNGLVDIVTLEVDHLGENDVTFKVWSPASKARLSPEQSRYLRSNSVIKEKILKNLKGKSRPFYHEGRCGIILDLTNCKA